MSRSRCRPRIDVHFNVGERHVDKQNLRVCRCDGLDRDAVILLLVNHFDAVADASAGVFDKVGAVIQQHWTVANKVTAWTKCAADKQT
jgi:hypothetical protein